MLTLALLCAKLCFAIKKKLLKGDFIMNKIVKKVLGVGLAVAMVGGIFAACTNGGTENENANTAEGKTFKVGICQLVQHEALDAATNGFKDELTKLAEADGNKIEFDEQNAAGDPATCATITNGFVADGVDLIMANATPALQAAAQSTTTIPVVATSVTDFASALEIKDWNGATGINVTGTSDLAPLAEQAAMFKTLAPEAKKIAIVYCSAEANSVYQAKEVAKELKALGFETVDKPASDTNDIGPVVTAACEECDALYIPTDNTMASATGTIEPIVTKANKLVIAGEEGICKGCGVATLSISYEAIGRNAGKMAYEILKDGKDPATMEVQVPTKDDVIFKYVAERAKALGITVPDDYEELALDAE